MSDSPWYQRQIYWIVAGVTVLLMVWIRNRPKHYPTSNLTNVIALWTSHNQADQALAAPVYDASAFVNGNLFTPRQVNVSPYYGSIQYVNDLSLLQSISTAVGAGTLPEDCYSLSTSDTANMTVDDANRIIANLVLKMALPVNAAALSHSYYDVAALTLLLYYFCLQIVGFSLTNVITATYDENQQVATVQMTSAAFSPYQTPFTLCLETYYQYLNAPVNELMTSVQLTNYLTSIAPNFRNVVSHLISYVYPTVIQKQSDYMTAYPSTVKALPVDVFSQVVTILMMEPFYPGGLSNDTGGNCS